MGLTFKRFIVSKLKTSAFPQYRIAALPVCLHRVRVMNYNPTDVNTAVILSVPLAGTPSTDLRLEALNKLLVVSCLCVTWGAVTAPVATRLTTDA